jgi:hypothetical protein
MNLLSKILDTLNLLHIRFSDNGEPTVEMVACNVHKGKVSTTDAVLVPDIATVKARLKKAPVVVAVSGKGVVTKEASAGGILETVTSDPATFLWTHSAAGSVSFIRRERPSKMLAELAGAGVVPLYTECLSDGETLSLTESAERYFSDRLKWSTVLKPSVEGSGLASMLARRIRLPVLGVVLLALIVNFALSAGVREQFGAASMELAALRKSVSSVAANSESRRAAIEKFSRSLPYRFSRLADRIAAAVPDKVVLSELVIAPVTKKVESGKPVVQDERTVVIRGESSSPEAIAAFTGELGKLGIGTVALSSVEQDRERTGLTFTIEIEL